MACAVAIQWIRVCLHVRIQDYDMGSGVFGTSICRSMEYKSYLPKLSRQIGYNYVYKIAGVQVPPCSWGI